MTKCTRLALLQVEPESQRGGGKVSHIETMALFSRDTNTDVLSNLCV